MGVLVTLTGAAPGCGYDNPGFKLKESDPVTSTDEPTTNVSGVTAVTSEPSTTTAIPTTSTTESMTTQGPGVSGSETSTTDVDPTTSTTETTTGGGGSWFFPVDCGEAAIPTPWADPAADTYFVNEAPQGVTCSFLPEGTMTQCRDLQFGETEEFPLFLTDGGVNFTDDYMSVFAVRFAPPAFIHEDMNGMTQIDPKYFVDVEVKFNVFHEDQNLLWSETTLEAHKGELDDLWVEHKGFDFTPCKSPAASFRCQRCPLGGGEGDCAEDWSKPHQPMSGTMKVHSFSVIKEPDAAMGTELVIKDLSKNDLGWLTTKGLMLFPVVDTPLGMLEVKSKELLDPKYRPGLRARYCTPIYTP